MLTHDCEPRKHAYPSATLVKPDPTDGRKHDWMLLNHVDTAVLQHVYFCPWCGQNLELEEVQNSTRLEIAAATAFVLKDVEN